MADSIVYEHESMGQNGQEKIAGSYRLVRTNNQVISISTDFVGNYDIIDFGEDYDERKFDKPTNIIITNLDSGKEIIKLPTNSFKIYIPHIEVFMYLPNILFVGFIDSTNKRAWTIIYKVWLIDLVNLSINKYFELNKVRSIYPVSNQYFVIKPELKSNFFSNSILSNNKSKVYSWDNLDKLNKLEAPVFQIDLDSQLSSIDWSSSSIKHFSTCAFVQTRKNSKQIDFLDKSFEPVVSLNVSDLFPNYQPVQTQTITITIKPTNQNESNKNYEPTKYNHIPDDNYIGRKIIANANCLLYLEYIKGDYLDFHKQSANIYCWDFTTNTQVNFPSNQKAQKVQSIIPFRNFANQIKYFAEEYDKHKIYGKVYESI